MTEKTVRGSSCNVREALTINCEYGNENALAVLKDGEIVGHLPHTILRVLWFFLRHGGCIVCRVSGKRRHDDGLENSLCLSILIILKQLFVFTGVGIN